MSEQGRSRGGNSDSGQPLRFSVPGLASLLGVSERAVLGQIERGELLAIYEEDGWMVYVDLPEVARANTGDNPANQSTAAQPRHDEVLSVTHTVEDRLTESAGRPPALPVPVAIPVSPVDLTLLINLVTDLTKRNAELLDSTATWRERVQHLESELQRVMISASAHDQSPEPALANSSAPAVESPQFEAERAARVAAETEVARLQGELRDVNRFQQGHQSSSRDPATQTAAGWHNQSPEFARDKPSWWRRMVEGF
jgi:hypothetical protein